MSIDTTSARGESPRATEPPTPRSGFYRAVWRWHFYSGLFTIPIIVLLCLSGIVWLLRPQIDSLMYSELRNVTPTESPVSYEKQLASVTMAFPESTITSAMPPPKADRSTQFDITTKDGSSRSVFVDPASGAVLGDRDNAKSLTQIALALHGSLMTGSWLGNEAIGDRVIEVVAGWSILLVVTGVILWWPRGRRRKTLQGVLVPRLSHRSKRTRWRDIHAITGVLFSFVTLFFLVTGMAWTGWWGPKYQDVATRLGSTYPEAITKGVSSTTVGDLPATGKAPWAASGLPVPLSAEPDASRSEPGNPATHKGHHNDGDSHSGSTEPGNSATHSQHHGGIVRWDPADGAPLDAVVTAAQTLDFTPGYAIFFPEDESGTYTVNRGPDLDPSPNTSAFDSRVAFIDQYTARPVQQVGFADYGNMAKATDLGISIHEGREWGWISQVLALLGTCAILLSVASSLVMWRKRRPAGLGAPTRVHSRRTTAILVGTGLALGVLFPLLGITLIAVLLFDRIVIRRLPRLARAFGSA